MSTAPHRVLGIDPGTRFCGWGVVQALGPVITHVDNGVIVLPERKPLSERLSLLFSALEGVIETYAPSSAACEGIFQHRNPRSALTLGHARGVALLAMARARMEVGEYSPQQVKKAVTGSGRADKLQIQHMVTMRLDLPEPPQEDAADAVAVALCHAQHLAFPTPAVTGLPPRPPRRMRGRAGLAALAESRGGVGIGRPPPSRPSRPSRRNSAEVQAGIARALGIELPEEES